MFDFRAAGCYTKEEENDFSWGCAQSFLDERFFKLANEGEIIFDPQ